MPKRALVEKLPRDVLVQLAARIARGGAGNYAAHAAWLQRRGFHISKSALHRGIAPHRADLMLLWRAQFIRAASHGQVTIGAALRACATADLAQAVRELTAHT